MSIEEMREVLKDIACGEYEFHIGQSPASGEPWLQARYLEADIAATVAAPVYQKTRKWKLSEHMVKSEIIQTALKCVLTSHEHRVREHFTYKGRRIYGPHLDADALWEIADRTEVRK